MGGGRLPWEEEGSHGRRKAPMGGGGGRPASGSLVHSTDLGRVPEETVVVRGQERMEARGVIECSHSRIGEDEWDGFHEDCSKSDWLVREQREEEVDIIGA